MKKTTFDERIISIYAFTFVKHLYSDRISY